MQEEESMGTKAKELPTVELGVPCYGGQNSSWWQNLMIDIIAEDKKTCNIIAASVSQSMLPDDNKNKIVEMTFAGQLLNEPHRIHQVDINRNQLARWFMNPETDPNKEKTIKAEWLVFVDSDTKPPKGFIGAMLAAKRRFVSGLYFLPSPPYNPIAYSRRNNGLYEAIVNYTSGQFMEVDSVGMGCALIHRTVFEDIQKNHTVYMNQINGAMVPIFNEDIKNKHRYTGPATRTFISNGLMQTPVQPVDWTTETGAWPFFALEYARTEDHFFCELANNIGVKPFLDTNIACAHQKTKDTTEKDYQENKDLYTEQLEMRLRHHGN